MRRLREERGFSQEKFAFRVGLHCTFRVGLHCIYMGDIERGKKNTTLVTADKLARGLGLSLVGLLLEMERGPDNSEE